MAKGDRRSSRWKYISAISRLGEAKGIVHTKDLADELQVKPASVTQMVKRLAGEGLLEYHPYQGVRLSELGVEEAGRIRERRLVLTQFFRLIGLSEDQSISQAREMGSRLSRESFSRLKTLVERARRETGIDDEDCVVLRLGTDDGGIAKAMET